MEITEIASLIQRLRHLPPPWQPTVVSKPYFIERRDTAESKHGNHEKDARANRSKQNQIININGYMATDWIAQNIMTSPQACCYKMLRRRLVAIQIIIIELYIIFTNQFNQGLRSKAKLPNAKLWIWVAPSKAIFDNARGEHVKSIFCFGQQTRAGRTLLS